MNGSPITRLRARRNLGDSPTTFAWPALLYLAVIVGGPLVLVMIYSFLARGKFGVGVVWEPTAKAWKQLVAEEQLDGSFRFNSQYLKIIGKSFMLAGAATVFTVICGVPLAVWMSFRTPRWRQLLVFAVTIPFWTNTLVRTYAWMLILNDNGLINRSLQKLGIIEQPLRLLYNSSATLVGLVYTFLPFMVLPVYASAEKFDFRLAEAAFDLGARRSQMLRRVVLPLIKPGIVAGIVLVFIPALGSFLQPELLGGGKSLMIGNLIQAQFGPSRNWPFGSALAAALMIIVLLVLMLFSWSSRKTVEQGSVQAGLL
jgi:spermidine/putrescine transport system permease protein